VAFGEEEGMAQYHTRKSRDSAIPPNAIEKATGEQERRTHGKEAGKLSLIELREARRWRPTPLQEDLGKKFGILYHQAGKKGKRRNTPRSGNETTPIQFSRGNKRENDMYNKGEGRKYKLHPS